MARKKTPLSERLTNVLADRRFFWAVMAVLVLESLWIAFSGLYPMAFDENYHLGIIKIYAHHLNPFLSGQPAGGDEFGALARDPSYLYQYLMSFPYRFISWITDSQAAQVIFLRVINVGLFAWGVVLYRRVMQKTGAGNALINAVLAVFVLLPVVPLLASQINYDNLLLPVSGLTMLTALKLTGVMRQSKKLDFKLLTCLVVLLLVGGLVKYPFLPIALAITIYVIVEAIRIFSWQHLWRALTDGFKSLKPAAQAISVTAILIATLLFGQRYVVNLVRYHTPVPECDKVLNEKSCSQYSVWQRNYSYKQDKQQRSVMEKSPVVFAADWFHGMWLRTFFSLAGPTVGYQTRGPLLLPGAGVIVFAAAGLTAFIAAGRKQFRGYHKHVLVFLAAVTLTYSGALFLDNYKAFIELGRPVAINGRYLVVVYPFIIMAAAIALRSLLGNRPRLKLAVFGSVMLCMLWGGGALTYILRSNDLWYWDNGAVRTVNKDVRNVLGPVTPGYRQPKLFMR
jgi:hypothetical protein